MGAPPSAGRTCGAVASLGFGVALLCAPWVSSADTVGSGRGVGAGAAADGQASPAGPTARGHRADAGRGPRGRLDPSAEAAPSAPGPAAEPGPPPDEPAPPPDPGQAAEVEEPPALPSATTAPGGRGRKAPAPAEAATGSGLERPQPLSAEPPLPAPPQAAPGAAVTADPSVTIVDGIIQGTLNAVSPRGLPLAYRAGGGSNGGKLSLGTVPTAVDPAQSFTVLPYATWLSGGPKGAEQFDVRISEVTAFDAFLAGIPLVGLAAAPVIQLLQSTPLVGALLAPLIGSSVLATVGVEVDKLAPGPTPVAFTYSVSSFDGAPISANFFPAAGLRAGEVAPTVLNGAGLAGGGWTAPYARCGICGADPPLTAETLGVGALRDAGYNVVAWTPRGESPSGGVLQLDNPFFEGRDVSALVSWVATATPAALTGPDDPELGMVGGSYGGSVQLTAAGVDPRIDAIVPTISWNSLNQSLYPAETFKTVYASSLLLSLIAINARINDAIYAAVATGVLFGAISESAQAVLASSGPTALLNRLTAPALLSQGVVDVLFPLGQSLDNAEAILANPFGTPAKVIWFCGGHGSCVDPINPDQGSVLRDSALAWLAGYVKGDGDPAAAIPGFQWYDQRGGHHASDLLPFQDGFATATTVADGPAGGPLLIVPVIGGSGPGPSGAPLPTSLGNAAKAANAINLDIPKTLLGTGTRVVGAPSLSFRYTGLGTSRAVFAQVVDNATGRVLGNIVTPVPVRLDGRERTASVELADIVYTVANPDTDNLTLQITSSATAFANASVGFIDISDIDVSLPFVN